jgi:dTDP-4-dehydrorhamnose 3,5-epimerase
MIKKLNIKGCFEIIYKKKKDKRGYFQRVFDFKSIYPKKNYNIRQISISYNKKKGTFRGFHFQKKPFEENKFVFCINGSILDIIIDLRKNSRTYLKKITKIISVKKNNIIFIPKGCAHGFLTLEKNTKVQYIIDKPYSVIHSTGINIKSKIVGKIRNIKIISNKDKKLEIFN